MEDKQSLSHTKWDCKYHIAKGRVQYILQGIITEEIRILLVKTFGREDIMYRLQGDMKRQLGNISGNRKLKIKDLTS